MQAICRIRACPSCRGVCVCVFACQVRPSVSPQCCAFEAQPQTARCWLKGRWCWSAACLNCTMQVPLQRPGAPAKTRHASRCLGLPKALYILGGAQSRRRQTSALTLLPTPVHTPHMYAYTFAYTYTQRMPMTGLWDQHEPLAGAASTCICAYAIP